MVPGPGQWTQVREAMSHRAAKYQQQVTGHAVEEAYVVKGVRFDGRSLTELVEAKGPGYANKFAKNLEPKGWFKQGAKDLVAQAERQIKAAGGIPIRWHVAEEKAAKAIQNLLDAAGLKGIEVVHTPVVK